MKTFTLLFLVVLLSIAFLAFTRPVVKAEGKRVHWDKHYDHVVPREYPVFLDPQTAYLDEQIMYSEWDQEISSSL